MALSAGAVPLHVRFAGGTNCSSFPYTCFAVLSVLEPNAAVPDSWRPAASDPRWFADDGKGADGVTGGHGLVGMRERTAACGGTLQAGPGREGFVVAATLPVG